MRPQAHISSKSIEVMGGNFWGTMYVDSWEMGILKIPIFPGFTRIPEPSQDFGKMAQNSGISCEIHVPGIPADTTRFG